MSTSDFWALVDKHKKKKSAFGIDTDIAPITTSSTGTTSGTADFWAKVEKYQEEQDKKSVFNLTVSPKDDEDIAPVKKEKERTWFTSGAFSDGYQIGDLSKTILGTGKDIRENLYAGVIGAGEKAIDFAAYLAGGVGKALGHDEFAQKTQKFIEKDIIDENKIARTMDNITGLGTGILNLLAVTDDTDDISVLGEKSDALAQSGGQLALTAGLQTVGVPWWVTSGVMSAGGEVEGAFKNDASYAEAGISAAVTAGAEILTEKISGGIKFGGKTLDDALTKEIARGISNKVVRTLSKIGLDMAGEGAEEVLSGAMSAVGQKLTYADDKELSELFSAEDALEAFIGGAVLGGGMSSVNAVSSKLQGVDYVSGMTASEEAVVKKEVENRIAEKEKSGTKLSKSEKTAIEEQVRKDMEKGYISTDTIEEVLGGDAYKSYQDTVKSEDSLVEQEKKLTEESKKLEGMVWEKMTGEQQVRRDELRTLLPDLRNKIKDQNANSQRDALKTKLSEEVKNLVQGENSRLLESYREVDRHKQRIEVDLNQYKDENARKTAENLSKVLDNSNKARDVLALMTKVSEDRGVSFSPADAQKFEGTSVALKRVKSFEADGTKTQYDIGSTNLSTEFQPVVTVNSQAVDNFTVDYKTGKITFDTAPTGNVSVEFRKDAVVNGKLSDGSIAINMKSKKYLESLVGHEVTHTLENTEFHGKLQSYIFEYAKKKGEYDSRYKQIADLYNGIEGANVEAELTAELVGDYLFQDSEFIKNLSTQHRNVFQKIYDEIKYLYKVATAGSEQARRLEQVKKAFDTAWRETGKVQKNTADGGVKYSFSPAEIQSIQNVGRKSVNNFNSQDIATTEKFAQRYWEEMGTKSPFYRAWFGDWRVNDATPVKIATNKGDTRGVQKNQDTGWDIQVSGKVFNETRNHSHSYNVAARPYLPYINDIVASAVLLDSHGIDTQKAKSENSLLMHSLYAIADIGNGPEVLKLYVEEMNNPNSTDTAKRSYQLQNIEKYRLAGKSSQKTASSISPVVGTTVTIADLISIVKSLDKNFVPNTPSKIVNSDGTPKVMYHGSQKQFTEFDRSKAKSSGLYGKGFYFTDSKSHAGTYGNLYEVYLDIKNPLQQGSEKVHRNQVRKYLEEVADNEDYSIENYGTYDIDTILDVVMGRNITADAFKIIQDINTTAIGNMVEAAELFNSVNGTKFDGIVVPTETVAFYPEQIKSATNNIGTFDRGNTDIRHSLSSEDTAPLKYGNSTTPGEEVMYKPAAEANAEAASVEEIAPVAATPEVQEPVEELFPDDLAPVQEEYEFLLAEREDIMGAMDARSAIGDTTGVESLLPEYEAVQTRIAEIERDDADRLASIDEADAPQEIDNAPEDVADNVPLTKTLVTELAKAVKAQLGLPNNRTAEVRELIERYSAEEFPSSAHLYTEIAERFGNYTEKYVDNDLKGIKSLLRTTGIHVDESIKGDIADYGSVMRKNFGRIRFSKEGLPVDVAYMEFNSVLPGLFPESIDVPTDQLLRIIEVANMETTVENQMEIDSETLAHVTDTIVNGVNSFKQNRKETLANRHGRESFNSLMESADQYVPPVKLQNNPPTRAEMNAPEDIAPVFDGAGGQQAFMPEVEVPADADAPKRITRSVLHENIMDSIKTTFREKGFELDDVFKNAKDLSTFATVDNTPQRVMEKALGYKQGQVLSDLTVNKVAQNETEGIKWLNSFTDKKNGLLKKISKQYGIKPGSKESAAAQMYAEGFYVGEKDAIIAYGDNELAKDFPDAQVQANIKGLARDPRIRQIYDETLAAINESRTRNAYPEIPRLDNYFLHFRAMEDTFSRLGLPFNPNDIRAKDLPTDLNGVTADLKPGQPYFASSMHRKGKRTSFDMLGGLEKYLTSAKNQIYHIDDIQTLRALRNYVAETYGQATGLQDLDLLSNEDAEQRIKDVYDSHLSTFAKFLNEEANVLAGKTSLIDRGLEGVIGRRGITFLDTLNRQVGSNMVGFNVSSSLTNLISPVQAFAKTNKFDFVKAMAQTSANKVGSIFGKGDGFAENSPVMIRRKGADSFYRTPYQKAADLGYVMMGVVDNLSTELIARTKYNEFTRKGMDAQQAHFETDKWVSRLMGDRSLGQQPQLYNSKMLGLVTKFQLEVRNQLDSQFYDTIQEAKVSTEEIESKLLRNAKTAAKVTSAFVQLAVMQHLFGKAFESVAGYNPAFDIIEAIVKTFGWDDEEESEDTVLDNIEEGFLSLLGDLPYTSTLTGGRIPISSALPITELIKGKDQYGNEKSRWETLTETAPYYILPGGYGQAKKTIQGLSMFDDDLPIAGSYTDSGNLRFPVEDTIGNRVQAGLFGQWASENARDYFDNERKPLSKKQTQELIDVGIPIKDYWKYREGLSGLDKLGEKADYINSLDLTTEQKNILINNIADRKENINMADYDEFSSFEEFDFASKNPEKYAFLQENGISYLKYKHTDDLFKKTYDWAFKNPEKYAFLKENNVTLEGYAMLTDDAKDAYEWAYQNPEKFTLSKAVSSNVVSYRQYASDLNDIRADKDENDKTISGSAKEKKIEYINSLDIDYGARLILFKNEYNADDTYNYEIIDYVNSRDDFSYEDRVTILSELGFKVLEDGTVQW